MMAQSQNQQSDPFAFLNTQSPSTSVQPKEFHEVKADKPLADFEEFPHVNLASASIPSESINLDLLTQDSLSVFGSANLSTDKDSKKKIQPAFFWSIDELYSLIENLKAKSAQHAQFLSLKQQYENETQQLYNTLWSFPVHQREGRELCGDTNMVAYTYPVRVAQYNENVSSILSNKFEELHRFNTAPVFSSLFEQTLAESQFTQYIQSFLPQNGQADYNILTKVLDSIFSVMKVHTETPLSNHTQALLRQLVLIMGTYLLEKKSEENFQKNAVQSSAPSNLLINLEDVPTVAQTQTTDILGFLSENNIIANSVPISTPNNQKLNIDNICIYFLVNLLGVDGCSWGGALLQPTITDVLYSKILHMLFVDKFDGKIHPEAEYLALLGQFPWSQLITELVKPERTEDMKSLIIFPIQKGLELAASKTYYKLMLALGKILVIISHTTPAYLSQTVAILMRSPWPSKLIFQPLLNSLRLDQADKQTTQLIFSELYHLFHQRVSEFSASPEDKRLGHRQQYLEYLVLNQHVLSNLYQIDPFVAQLNDIHHTQTTAPQNAQNPQASPGTMIAPARCPLLTVLVNVAERAADVNDFDVPKVCVQELFYYAFVASPPPPTHPNQPVDQKKQHLNQSLLAWLPYVKSEAATQLGRLLTIKPHLVGWLVHCIGQHLPVLNPEQVLTFLNGHSSIFSSWVIDIGSVNWISYFLTHRTLPPAYENGVEHGDIVRTWIHTFLRSPPQVQFTQNAYVNGVTFGSRLIELIHWEKSEPSVRSLVVLLLMAAKSIQVNHQWLWQALLSPVIGLKLLAAPIERNFLEQINSVNPREVVCPDELSLVQVFCALDLVDQHLDGKQSGTAYDVRWLEQTQFYQRVESILFKLQNPHNLLVRIMHTLKFEPELGYQSLSRLLTFVMIEKDKLANRALSMNGQAPESGYDTIHKLFSKTITLPTYHELWLKLWTLVLLSKIPDDNTFCTLLDSLIHSEFCINSKVFQKVIECFQMEGAIRVGNKKVITKLHSSGFVWIAYCSTLVLQPAFPREITHDHLPSMQNDNQLLNSFKESRIWLWKDLAMSTKDSILALLYWEQFFLMYFQAMSKSAATMNRVITPSLKDQLNKHFVSTAQQFTHLVGGPINADMKNENNKKIYTVYYAFTTWATDVIFDRFTGKIFFDLDLVDEDMKGLDPSPPPMSVLISTHEPMYTVALPKSSPADSNNNAEPPKPTPSLIDLMDSQPVTVPVQAAPAKLPSNPFLVDILSKLMASLPPRVLPLSPQVIPEHSLIKSLESFQQEATSIIESLMADSVTSYATGNSNKKTSKTKLPFMDEFRNYVTEYNQLVASLKLADDGMLSLSSQLYQNNPATFQVTVPCRFGQACAEPAYITCSGVSIVPGYPEVRSDIDKNRVAFTRDYNNLVALGRQFAHKVALLKYVKDFLLQHYIDRSTAINRTAYNLFYSLVALLIENSIPSVLFHISHSISQDANMLGMQFIANNPEPQKKFLSILMKHSAKTEARIDSKTEWLKLIKCLTPIACLKNHDRVTYLQMLAKIANPQYTAPSPVLNAISNQFCVNEQIKALVGLCNEEEIDFLLQHLPNFILQSALDDVTRDIIYSILFVCVMVSLLTIKTSFPKNVDKVINAILNVAMTEQRQLGGAPLSSHTLHSVQWLDLLSSQIKFDMLTLDNSKRLFQLLASHCPLHDSIMKYVIQIAFKMLTDIPMLMVTLYEEIQSNASEHELIQIQASSVSPPVNIPIWDDIETFIAACLRPVSLPSNKAPVTPSSSPFAMASASQINCYPLSASSFASVLNLLHELVDKVPSLLDKAFSCFSHVVHMYTNSLILTLVVDNIHEYRQVTHNFLNQMPWHDATILQSDPLSVIKILIDLMLNGGDHVSSTILYSRLQWLPWLQTVQSNFASGNNSSYFVKTLLYFLKLSIYIHILNPDCISSQLFSVIFPPTPNSPQQNTSVQNLMVIWQFVEIGQFEEVFDGHSMIDLLKVCGTSDPSNRIVEIVFAMIEIINHLPHRAQPAASLANEIRSLLFATVANHTDSVYWHIPYQQQCALLTGCLIPIVRFASNAQQLPQLLITLLSCLNHVHFWPTPFRHGLPFVNRPEPPHGRVIFVTHPPQFFNSHYAPPATYRQMVDPDGTNIKQFKEFSGKIQGIISQFVSSVSPQIALEIVNIGPLAIQNYEILCEIYEETLHSLFSQIESDEMLTNVLSQATACLQYPSELNRYDFMQRCSTQHCTLTLRVLLEQERKRMNDTKDSVQWMVFASELVAIVVKFVPNMQHYEYDIFVLWWFLLELINDDRWHVERKGATIMDEPTQSVYKYFQEYAGVVGLKNVSNMKDLKESIISIKSLLSNRTKLPAIHLGAKACLLYLERITIQKKYRYLSSMGFNDNNTPGESKEAESKRVMDQLDKLLVLGKDQQFEGFATFFNEVQSLNSSQMDLKEFKLLLANHLAPIYTYLTRFA